MINSFYKNKYFSSNNESMQCNLIVCAGTYATVPYYYEGSEVTFWSIEEICYYITENACLIESSFADARLVNWIATECNLVDLARELQKHINKRDAVEQFVRIILEESSYSSANEIMELLRIIRGQLDVDSIVAEKGRADYFLEKGRKRKAIEIYRNIMYQIEDENLLLKSQVIHNLGVAYAGLFEFQKATICFWDAFQLTNQKVHYLAYLSAKRLQLKESEYVDFVATQQDKYDWFMEFEQIVSKALDDYKKSGNLIKWSKVKANRGTRDYEEFLVALQEEYKRNEY
ncbi:MAG: hypothetical protein R3Y54_13800, partial [Eubacteriales bacterium]